jgi:multiple sugar transport system permease protein
MDCSASPVGLALRPSIAMTVIIILAVWTTSGTFMLIFLAALRNVPAEIEEAAIMDGAGAWQRLRCAASPRRCCAP